MISAYILGCCVIGFIATLALRDRQALDHTMGYEEQEATTEGYRRPAMGWREEPSFLKGAPPSGRRLSPSAARRLLRSC
jgi:hypothetical protein